MKALVLTDPKKAPQLDANSAEPQAGDGQKVVTVVAAALNPVDLMQASNSTVGDLPRVVGNEAVVAHDGGLAYAERAVAPFGSIAERTVVETTALVDIPDGVSPSAAVSLGIPAIAAWMSLTHVGHLERGETVLVLGATGAAGRIAVQAAKLLGAGQVIAAGRRRNALVPLTDLGADGIAVLGGDDDAEALRDTAGGGIDLIFDPLFGAPLTAAVAALNSGGRSVTIGMSAGPTAELSFTEFLGKKVLSYGNMTAPADLKADAYRQLVEHLAAGRLVTSSEDIPLEQAEDAWARQQDGPDRKLVLRP